MSARDDTNRLPIQMMGYIFNQVSNMHMFNVLNEHMKHALTPLTFHISLPARNLLFVSKRGTGANSSRMLARDKRALSLCNLRKGSTSLSLQFCTVCC